MPGQELLVAYDVNDSHKRNPQTFYGLSGPRLSTAYPQNEKAYGFTANTSAFLSGMGEIVEISVLLKSKNALFSLVG